VLETAPRVGVVVALSVSLIVHEALPVSEWESSGSDGVSRSDSVSRGVLLPPDAVGVPLACRSDSLSDAPSDSDAVCVAVLWAEGDGVLGESVPDAACVTESLDVR
jgi:hypothetical protein